MSDVNVEIVRNSLDGWNPGDFDAWMAPAHPRIEFFSSIKGLVEGDKTACRGAGEMRRL